MSDPAKLLAYLNQTSLELSLLAEAGHKQLVTATNAEGTVAFAIALGADAAAELNRQVAKMEADPEFQASRARHASQTEANIVAMIAPERN
jgi:type II secretory pathway component HofQ